MITINIRVAKTSYNRKQKKKKKSFKFFNKAFISKCANVFQTSGKSEIKVNFSIFLFF